jgi:hypothetical protein
MSIREAGAAVRHGRRKGDKIAATAVDLAKQRRLDKARALVEHSAQFNIPALGLFLGWSDRKVCYVRSEDPTFPQPISTRGRPMFRRVDVEKWLAEQETVGPRGAEPPQLAASHAQVHRIAEPRARRAVTKPAAARKATRQTARPGV